MLDKGVVGEEGGEGVGVDEMVVFAVRLAGTGLPCCVWGAVRGCVCGEGGRTGYAETKRVWDVAKETGEEGALPDAGRAKHDQGTHGV